MKKEDGEYVRNLISILGAGVLGSGLGVYFSKTFEPYAVWLIILGIVMHGGAMLKNR